MFCPNFNKLFEFLVYTLLKTEFSKKDFTGYLLTKKVFEYKKHLKLNLFLIFNTSK
jgi:hypothetical protein